MNDSTSELPSWVCRRDGRVVPLEPDKICQAIYLASESLQQPNAFLARELTDGVLHFLAQEHGGGTPTTAQIADLVVKVLRELGQGPLAQAFAKNRKRRPGQAEAATAHSVPVPLEPHGDPARFEDDCRRLFSRHAVFSRDIQAAQDEGFLSLAGLEHPAQLAGGAVSWPGTDPEGTSLLPAILQARRRFGGCVILDNPEHALLTSGPAQIRDFVRQLRQGLESTKLEAIVNLNAAEAPPWAQHAGQGPLFASEAGSAVAGVLPAVRQTLLNAVFEQFSVDDPGRIDWHLGAADFQQNELAVAPVVEAACQGRPLSFVFDRPGTPSALCDGVCRRNSALLLTAGLHLPRLAGLAEAVGNFEEFLRKLLHLAQMAVSAAVQKRRFLKDWSEHGGKQAEDLGRGFFLDRARLVVIPVGLPAVVQRFAGQPMTGKQGLQAARDIVQRLGQCLQQAGKAVNVDAVQGSPWWTRPLPGSGPFFTQPHLTGLTSADFSASAEEQLRCAGALHQLAGGGTACLLLPPELAANTRRLAELLHFAWKKTGVVRLRLKRIQAAETVLEMGN